jgi:hypothetical protein
MNDCRKRDKQKSHQNSDDGFHAIRSCALSGGLRNPIRFEAIRADSHAARTAFDTCTDLLQVWHPASARAVMCMRDVVAAHGFLATDIANTCHRSPQVEKSDKYMDSLHEKQGFSILLLNVVTSFRTISP